MINKNRIALAAVENAKVYIEKAWPNDKELLNKIRDVLVLICYKVEALERNSENASS